MLYAENPIDNDEKAGLINRLLRSYQPLIQLFAAPTLLTMVLLGLIALNPEAKQQTELPPQPKPPQSIPIAAKPYLEAEEDLRLGEKYSGDTKLTLITKPADFYQGYLVLVNQSQKLPNDYLAKDLVKAREVIAVPNPEDLSVSKADLMLNQNVIDQLLKMVQGAYEDGVTGYTIVSGHRDLAYQVGLFQRKINQYKQFGLDAQAAEERAKQIVAVPGESEHHTGLALDLPSRKHPALETSYLDTPQGAWLKEHAWEYGFVIRYPADKVDITGISYEPWHIRYVGLPHSAVMQRENWCLEEYIEALRQNGSVRVRLDDGTIWQVDYQLDDDGVLTVPKDLTYSISGDGRDGFIITTAIDDTVLDKQQALTVE